MAGFFSLNQIELVRPYINKFYEALPKIESEHGFKYLQSFNAYMLPSLEIEDSHIVKLLNIKS